MNLSDSIPAKMMAFEGAQSILIPDSSELRPERTNLFSFSVFFRTIDDDSLAFFSSLNASTSLGIEFGMRPDGELLLGLINTPGSNHLATDTDATYNDGKLHHALVTYGGGSTPGSIKFYVDGVLVTSSTVANTLSSTIVGTAQIALGARFNTSTAFMSGYMRNLWFFDYELTAADAVILNNRGELSIPNFAKLSGARPVDYWPLEYGAKDHGANSNHGSLDGFAVGLAYIRSAGSNKRTLIKAERAPIGDAGIGMLSAADTISGGFDIDVGDPCTWSWWQKLSAGSRPFHCKLVPTGGADGWGMQVSGSPMKFFWSCAQISNSLGLQFESVNGFPQDATGQMHHFALVKTASGANLSNFTLYLNGEVFPITQTTPGTAGTMQDGTNELWIGGREESSPQAGMGTTNAAMFASAFTQTQIRGLTAKGFDGDISVLNSPLGNWLMMDPADVTTFQDWSDNGADLTITSEGPPTWANFDKQVFNPNFNSKTYHLTSTDGSLLFDRLDARTISFWYYRDDAAELNMGISAQIDPLGTPAGFRVTGGGTAGLLIAMGISGASGALSLSHALAVSGNKKWHHVAVAKSASGGRAADVDVYYDGALVSSTIVLDTWTSGSQNGGSTQMRIGFVDSADRGTNIKNYVQHSTQFNAADILVLYSIGKDGDYSDVLSPLAVFPLDSPPAANNSIDTAGTLTLSSVGGDTVYSARDVP